MPHTRPITRRDAIRAAWLIGSGAALGALVVPSLSGGGPSAHALAGADPTKTREAELDELHGLQTRVAQPAVCTPAPTETPIPPTATATLVPAVEAGVALPYGDRFLVTVLGIAPVPPGGDVTTQGQLLRVNVTLVNKTDAPIIPPFNDWRLVDGSGQPYRVSTDATNAIVGIGWGLTIAPGESADRGVVFDVLPDAGTSFTLESREEPAFRVALAIESRG